jgi:NMD protein affecting ribosome stability and mRNA decay
MKWNANRREFTKLPPRGVNYPGGRFITLFSGRRCAMCFEYHERLAWIRRVEQMEKELKEAGLARAEAKRKRADERQPTPEPGAQEEPVPV